MIFLALSLTFSLSKTAAGQSGNYVGVMALGDTGFIVARENSGGQHVILKASHSSFQPVARLASPSGTVRGINLFRKSGKAAVLVVDSTLYSLTFANGKTLAATKGTLVTIPLKVGPKWVGAYINQDQETKVFTLGSDGFKDAPKPQTLTGLSVIDGRLLYSVKLSSGKTQTRLTTKPPAIRQGRLTLDPTTVAPFQLADRWCVGTPVGSTGYTLCRERTGKYMCDVWLCRASSSGIKKMYLVDKGSGWTDASLDEAYVMGGNILLFVYDGNVSRTLCHFNMRSKSALRLSNDVQPPSPSQTLNSVYGSLIEPVASLQGTKPNKHLLYALSRQGLQLGELPKPWFQIFGSGPAIYASPSSDSPAHSGILRLRSFPRYVSGKWIGLVR